VLQAVGDIVVGSVLGPSSQRANESRIAMFLAGFPETVPVRTVNRCTARLYILPAASIGIPSMRCKPGSFRESFCEAIHCPEPWLTWRHVPPCRQCSSGLQAIADVAAAIQSGYYTIGIGAGVETMSINPMAWEGGVNPKVETCPAAGNCLLPMGAPLLHCLSSRAACAW